MQVRRTRHAGHCCGSKDKLMSDNTPVQRGGRPARTYLQKLYADTGFIPEDLPEAMDDREGWWEKVRDIRADGATWWWWWHNRYLLFCCVLSILALIWLVLMVLFCADSVSLWRFIFLSHVHVFLGEMLLISRLNVYRVVCLPIFAFSFFRSVGPRVVSIVSRGYNQSLFVLFYVVKSLIWCVNTVLMSTSSLPPFLDTYNLSASSLGCNALCMVTSFLAIWSICSSSSLVHLKNCPDYLTWRDSPRIYSFDKVSAI